MSTHVGIHRRAAAGALTLTVVLVITLSCGNPSGQGNGCASTGADVTINAQDNLTFSPTPVTITKGQRVCWQNAGSLSHTVTAIGATPGDSTWTPATFDATLNPDGVAIHTFSTSGVHTYHCLIHGTMTGTINVP